VTPVHEHSSSLTETQIRSLTPVHEHSPSLTETQIESPTPIHEHSPSLTETQIRSPMPIREHSSSLMDIQTTFLSQTSSTLVHEQSPTSINAKPDLSSLETNQIKSRCHHKKTIRYPYGKGCKHCRST